MKTFEDFPPGHELVLGRYPMTREEIVEFASRYDPQPFHVDEEAAKQSHFGGLIASGWHTASAMMRLMVDGFLLDTVTHGSPGIDEIRWLRPVRPGDVLTGKAIVVEARPSSRRNDRGYVKLRYEMANQKGELVMTVVGTSIFGRNGLNLSSQRHQPLR